MKKVLIISALFLCASSLGDTAFAATCDNGERLALTSSQIETIQQRREARYNELQKKHEQNKESIKNEVSFWKKLFNDDSAKTEAQKRQEETHKAIEKEASFWKNLFKN